MILVYYRVHRVPGRLIDCEGIIIKVKCFGNDRCGATVAKLLGNRLSFDWFGVLQYSVVEYDSQ